MTPTGVAEAVDALGATFLAGDPDAVLDHFAGTGDVVYAGSESGEVAVGRPAIRALLATIFARDERYSWHTTSLAVAAGSDTAYVVAEARLLVHPVVAGSLGPATEELAYRISGVLERERGRWHWRLCHGSEPIRPEAATEGDAQPCPHQEPR